LNTTLPGLGKITDVFDNTIAFEMKMEIFELDAKVASLNFCRNYKTRELSRFF